MATFREILGKNTIFNEHPVAVMTEEREERVDNVIFKDAFGVIKEQIVKFFQ